VIGMLLRFYGGAITFESVWKLTLRQVAGLLEQMSKVYKMETGTIETEPLTGEAAKKMAAAQFGRKK